jgi:NodT family efflux transporter outer membrane factor (OMF) lipoprotein
MTMTMKKNLLIGVMAAAIAVTSVARAETTSRVQVESSWRYAESSAPAETRTAAQSGLNQDGYNYQTDQWWTAFDDEGLNRFVESVLESNNGLAAAAIAARRARAQADLNAAQTGVQISAGVNGGANTEDDKSSYSASGALSYELDLWGRVAAERNAARWEAEATDEDRQAVALALVGSAATLYYQLAYLNLQIESAEESLAYAERAKTLVDAQYNAGAVSGLEVSEAEQTVQTQRASLTSLTQSRVETRNAMAALRDGEPWPEAAEPSSLPQNLPDVEAGLPADVLARRPDLRAAEMRLESTLASGQATQRSYYPSITLTANASGASTSLADLISNPVGAIAAAISFPFLQANEMRLATRVTEAQYEEAALSFRQTLQEALVEVENALSARTQLKTRSDQLEAALTASQTGETLYEARYRAGATTLREWLDAQERRRQADLTLQQNRLNELTNQVSLYLALGGSA